MGGARAGGRGRIGGPNKYVRLLQRLAVLLRNKLEMVAATAPWGGAASGALEPLPLLLLLLLNRGAGDDPQVAVLSLIHI